jgi:hypothetical protein
MAAFNLLAAPPSQSPPTGLGSRAPGGLRAGPSRPAKGRGRNATLRRVSAGARIWDGAGPGRDPGCGLRWLRADLRAGLRGGLRAGSVAEHGGQDVLRAQVRRGDGGGDARGALAVLRRVGGENECAQADCNLHDI